MRERERIVKMERINNIRIRQWPELAETVDSSPVCSGRDDSVLRSRLANRSDDALLEGVPLGFASAEYGLVYHFKEEHFRAEMPQLSSQSPPEYRKSPGPAGVIFYSRLHIVVRVEHDRKIM